MFRATFLLFVVSLSISHAWSADFSEPAALPADRYAAMREKSPFALATASVPIASTGSFAANWYLGAIGRLGDTDFVTIKSRDLSVQFTLFGHEPNPEHRVSISSVNWSDTVGESSVILQKGTETAKLEFNQSLLRAPAPAACGAHLRSSARFRSHPCRPREHPGHRPQPGRSPIPNGRAQSDHDPETSPDHRPAQVADRSAESTV